MQIAIDGPAGTGKSTVAKLIAARFGARYLDTGAMYRAVAWRALQEGIPFDDEDAIGAIARTEAIRFFDPEEEGGPQRVVIGGQDVTIQIRTPEVDRAVSPVSALPRVRAALVQQQRDIASEGDVVLEGRDIGTNVLPDAEVKVFMQASAEVRAKRRLEQNRQRGITDQGYEQILEAIEARDAFDSTRAVDPLRPALDAHIIDTSDLTIEDVLDAIAALVSEADKDATHG